MKAGQKGLVLVGEGRSAVAVEVADTAAAVLGFSESAAVSPQIGFFELGMDSLMALDLKNRLEKNLGLPLKPTLAFDWPCVQKLTAHLLALAVSSPASSHVMPLSRGRESIVTTSECDASPSEIEALLASKLSRLEDLVE